MRCIDNTALQCRMSPTFSLLPQRAVPVSGTKSQGGYSLLKRECPPRPPKEKRGGISISPRTPLKRLKGAKLRFLPFGNPSKDKGSGSGKGGRGCPLCTPMNAAPTDAGTQLFEEHLSAQPAGDFWILPAVCIGRSFVWVSWPMRGQLIPDTFSFPPCTAHFLFGVSKRKWGVHSGRQSLHPCGGSPHICAQTWCAI